MDTADLDHSSLHTATTAIASNPTAYLKLSTCGSQTVKTFRRDSYRQPVTLVPPHVIVEMESIQLAQMLADISDLSAAVSFMKPHSKIIV